MDTKLLAALLTVVGVFIANAAIIIPMFFWNRAESRADLRHMGAKLDSMRELTYAIHTEMKNFHTRLCSIEEKKRKFSPKQYFDLYLIQILIILIYNIFKLIFEGDICPLHPIKRLVLSIR